MLDDGRVDRDALICARYWRNSLADVGLGRGAFRNDEVAAFIPVDGSLLLKGRVDTEAVAALFQDSHAEAESRTVLVRPFVYRARTEHGRRFSPLPDVLTPIVSQVTLSQDGQLTIPKNTVVPRDLLEPLDRNAFTIGTVEEQDSFLTRFPEPSGATEVEAEGGSSTANWSAFRQYCDQFAQAVFPTLASDERFERTEESFIEVRLRTLTSRHVDALYDHMEKDQPPALLFSTFASRPLTEAEPCLESHAGFVARLGHSSARYALADEQRNALNHLLAAEHGELVTVNGPPGTGKTTLLLSVVASLWAKAALDRDRAPIIFAASTNNQAITNIIDSFGADFSEGEGPFAGRWLPDLTSFASYFPAPSRSVPDTYLTGEFFDHVEDADYLDQARSAFLRAADIAFPDLENLRVETVVERLHGELRAQADALAEIESAWLALVSTRERGHAVLGNKAEAERRRREAEAAEHESQRAQELGVAWDQHLAEEPLLQVLFDWLPPVARKRLGGARAALRSHWLGPLPDWKSIADIGSTIAGIAEEARTRATKFRASLAEADELLQAERAGLERWCAALHCLGVDLGEAGRMTLVDSDPLADRLLRFPIFQTATHYWEGRWLLEMAAIEDLADQKRRRGRSVMIPRWRRRMMLTPCAVSTFYVLPGLMRARRYDRDGTFGDDYLYDTIDLLIVDEAGQTTPPVAGAAFALARRALVIGDTEQIEPIWDLPGRVDAGNLRAAGLLTAEDEQAGLNLFVKSGRAASSGSVMRVAQHVSRYHQDPDLARGLILYEHRRCFDEIISYCNDLCYRGKLKPQRGRKADATGPDADGLPAMGFLQVDGLCEQLPGGSRRNVAEAETIAAWIADRKVSLEQSYPEQRLSEILGIVTPFAAQVRTIQTALNSVGIDTEQGTGVTIGSVHAFQGGQRRVMIFSPTYSKHADGNFIDTSTSMLNVAVSRAMNSFLVFGDMDCFSTAPRGSPRGQLGARLASAAEAALTFVQPPRRDLMRRAQLEYLRDAAAHDAFLCDVLARSRREVQVVTPWLSQRALDESGLVPALSAAVARGIALTVYTDRMLNAQRVAHDESAFDSLASALETLREVGAGLIEVCGVHSKILMADEDLFCAGSFNWFSASRDGAYARHETSLAYRGPAVAKEIEAMKASLQRRMAR
jgi:hypothetical protein